MTNPLRSVGHTNGVYIETDQISYKIVSLKVLVSVGIDKNRKYIFSLSE